MVPDLFPKSSSAKYSACAQSSPRVTPYSGLGQLDDDAADPSPTPHNDAAATKNSPVYSRIMLQKPKHLFSTNQFECDSPPVSQRSLSDHVINIGDLHPQHESVGDFNDDAAAPECLITCRRKTTYEARVRLSSHAKPIYVGRYKTEQAAHDACGRLLRQTTPRRGCPKTK